MTEKQIITKFIEDISLITQRPPMFQLTDVYGIQLAMYGYLMGRESKILNDFYGDFQDFINKEFAKDFTSEKKHDWPRLIWFNSSDGLHSITLFNLLFEKFFDSYKQKLDEPL